MILLDCRWLYKPVWNFYKNFKLSIWITRFKLGLIAKLSYGTSAGETVSRMLSRHSQSLATQTIRLMAEFELNKLSWIAWLGWWIEFSEFLMFSVRESRRRQCSAERLSFSIWEFQIPIFHFFNSNLQINRLKLSNQSFQRSLCQIEMVPIEWQTGISVWIPDFGNFKSESATCRLQIFVWKFFQFC